MQGAQCHAGCSSELSDELIALSLTIDSTAAERLIISQDCHLFFSGKIVTSKASIHTQNHSRIGSLIRFQALARTEL
jgi:hypothetical protein